MFFGDFYKEWLNMKMDMEEISLSVDVNVLNIIKIRETTLLNTPTLIACLYLDPRFKFILKPNEIEQAQNHLIELY